jgi:DMSO reductase family type II enzyme heme b subunit
MRKPDWLPTIGWLSIDRSAAAHATVLAAAVLVVLLLLQGAVTAALTSGVQPMAAVDAVPTDPTDEAWADAPNRTVDLSKQQMALPIGGGSVDEMDVQATTNESHVAFRLSWDDPTNDTSLSEPRAYSDAAAIMFHGGSTPPITMGAAGTPVNVWYWRSNWQFGQNDTAPWTGSMYAYPHPDNETRPGTAAGNPLSKASYDQFAQNYYAKGYGSLSNAPVQPVHANAERTTEGWSVSFVRERGTNGTYDAAFSDDEPMFLAFAVWNGSADEVNGKKSITLQFTRLDPANASLAAVDPGGSGSGDDSGADGGAGGSVGALPTSLGPWLAALVGATMVAWLVSYRRIQE